MEGLESEEAPPAPHSTLPRLCGQTRHPQVGRSQSNLQV